MVSEEEERQKEDRREGGRGRSMRKRGQEEEERDATSEMRRELRLLSQALIVRVLSCACMLVQASPLVPKDAASAKRHCVLVIGIDGCRPDCLTPEFAPYIYKLMHDPSSWKQTSSDPSMQATTAYSLESQVGDICWSGPGWTSACTGTWRDKHGVSGNTFVNQQFASYPNIFQRIRTAHPEMVTACSINWKPLAENILLPATFSFTHEDKDSEVVESACKLLREQARMDCLFVHLDDVDLAGHSYDYGPQIKEYVASVQEMDQRVARIIHTLQEQRPFYPEEDWLILLTTDHGGIDYTHEDTRPENRTNFLILHGADLVSGEIFPAPLVVDVAPTVLAHLGIKIQSAWHLDGRVVALKLRGPGRRKNGGAGSHFLCLESSMDPLNKYPIPKEELEEGPAAVEPIHQHHEEAAKKEESAAPAVLSPPAAALAEATV